MAGSYVIVVMYNGVSVSVCLYSTFLTSYLFYSALLTVAAAAHVASRLESLRRVLALMWLLYGPQSLRGVPPSKSMLSGLCVHSALFLPMFSQASPHVFPHLSSPNSCHFHKRGHTQCSFCLQGRQFTELWIMPLWNENLAVYGAVVTLRAREKDFNKPTVVGTP